MPVVREIMRNEAFLTQKAEPATLEDLPVAWASRKQTLNWVGLSRISKNIAGKPTDIAGCGYGWRVKGSTGTPKQYCEP